MRSPLSLLLTLLLVLTPLAALADDGQGSYDVSFTWHSPDILGDEENALLTSFFDAISFTGSYGADGDAQYHDMDLLIGGAPALSIDTYLSEQGIYAHSPLLNGAAGIDIEKMMNQAMLEVETDPELGAIMSTLTSMTAMFEKLAEQDPDELFASLQMDAVLEELIELILGKVQAVIENPAPYAGIIHSTMGVETYAANVYTVTGADLMGLLHGFFTTLADHEEYWDSILTLFDYDALLDEADVTREEVLAELTGTLREIADLIDVDDDGDIIIEVFECVDSQGVPVLYQIKLTQATVYSYSDPFASIVEWVPGKAGFYTHFGDDSSSVEIKYITTDNGWLAFLQIHDYWDVTTLMFRASCDENGQYFEFAQLEDGQVSWGFTVETVCNDSQAEITFGYWEGADKGPILTITCNRSDEAAPPRFNPATFEGIIQYPLDMQPDEIESFGEMIQISAMQALLRALGMLPPDVFGAVMNDFGFLF